MLRRALLPLVLAAAPAAAQDDPPPPSPAQIAAARAEGSQMIAAARAERMTLSARIVETSRNTPVRNIYRDNGFVLDAGGLWRLAGAYTSAA